MRYSIYLFEVLEETMEKWDLWTEYIYNGVKNFI